MRKLIPTASCVLQRAPIWSLMIFTAWMTRGINASSIPSQDSTLPTERADTSWWSLQKLTAPVRSIVINQNWVNNPLDTFVLHTLEASGLRPASPALAQQLIRRLSFDLTGLPPDPTEVARFADDYANDPDAAVARRVDQLLASPHYGERWARHWLDVARFGESDGYEYDKLRPHAWRYRDWVIRALNDDLPYDRFAQWQIAGDVLAPYNADAIAATGFLVAGAFDGLLPQGEKMRKIMREDEMEDLVGTVGQTFLGLTVHCARCHDHKFDPISQREYFQMASALAGVHRGERNLPQTGNPEPLRQRITELKSWLCQLEAPVRRGLVKERGRPTTEPPAPAALWTFEEDLRDSVGSLHGEAHGDARLENGALWLDGRSGWMSTPPLARSLAAKTLEVWVKPASLDQRGGAPLSLQTLDSRRFDAIVLGEREPGRWEAGSEGFQRTQSFGGVTESGPQNEFIQIVIVHEEDGTIAAYRNGEPYGKPYRAEAGPEFAAGAAQWIFGLRHGTAATSGRMFAGWIDQAAFYDRALTAAEVAASARRFQVSEEELLAGFTPEQRRQRDEWRDEITRQEAELDRLLNRKAFAVVPKPADIAHVLARGSPFQPGEPVAAGGVAALQGPNPCFDLAPDAPEADRRAALARWISHPDNPLFARVMVNRVWHHLFGQGLVKTPNDFGFNGGQPSHPELLDWLANEFRHEGWSVKRLLRLITTSATYRQAAAPDAGALRADASNRLLWRHAPRRLDAEELRDAILAVSGVLDRTVGGPGYRDFHMRLHKGSWFYDPIDPEGAEFNRRSIYRTWARGSLHPLLHSFDCPDPSTTTPARGLTTTPLSALALLNTSFVLRMADHFAARLRDEAGDQPEGQIVRAYRLAFARDPQPRELALAREFIRDHDLPAWCRVIFNANEFLHLH